MSGHDDVIPSSSLRNRGPERAEHCLGPRYACVTQSLAGVGTGTWLPPPGCPAPGVPALLLACGHGPALPLRWPWAQPWGRNTRETGLPGWAVLSWPLPRPPSTSHTSTASWDQPAFRQPSAAPEGRGGTSRSTAATCRMMKSDQLQLCESPRLGLLVTQQWVAVVLKTSQL